MSQPTPNPLPCGCRAEDETDESSPKGQLFRFVVKHCPLHAAAPDLLAALKGVVALADRAHTHWDNDQDSKVGKILAAMAGHLKKYAPESTAIHAAIAAAEPPTAKGK